MSLHVHARTLRPGRHSAAGTDASALHGRRNLVMMHASTMPPIDTDSVDIAVLGDLHLKPEQMHAFADARQQLQDALRYQPGTSKLVVQLGDVGTGPSSGTVPAFTLARDYLAGFEGTEWHVITGNHDLEGEPYNTDAEALAAWQSVFDQQPYWCRDVGPCLLVGLSTTRYRSNAMSHHEVHIDEAQLEWFAGVLQREEPDKPVIVFSHAPPMGCGLKVINDLHIKNRCGWLNHSANPRVFLDLVREHGRVKAWFSGHFHLSHNYADSITSTAGCLFVQTGVIGPHCHRDGCRQSRLLHATPERCEIWTVDHEDGGRKRLDAEFEWQSSESARIVTPDEEIICDVSAGFVCARDACSVLWREGVKWYTVGSETLLAHQDGMLLEYDIATFAPTGAVTLEAEDCVVRLVDDSGSDVTKKTLGDGSNVAAVELVDSSGQAHERFTRNKWGSFFKVYQPNKWQLQQAKNGIIAERAEGALPVA